MGDDCRWCNHTECSCGCATCNAFVDGVARGAINATPCSCPSCERARADRVIAHGERCDVEIEWDRAVAIIKLNERRTRELDGLRRVIDIYELDYYDRCAVEKLLTPDDAPVHLAVRNSKTQLFGCYLTPLEFKSTACREVLTEEVRRTLRPSLVTCDACKAYAFKNDLTDDWTRRRR